MVVKEQSPDRPLVYKSLLRTIREFSPKSTNIAETTKEICSLFAGHLTLLLGFSSFLPCRYRIEVRPDGTGSLREDVPWQLEAMIAPANVPAKPRTDLPSVNAMGEIYPVRSLLPKEADLNVVCNLMKQLVDSGVSKSKLERAVDLMERSLEANKSPSTADALAASMLQIVGEQILSPTPAAETAVRTRGSTLQADGA